MSGHLATPYPVLPAVTGGLHGGSIKTGSRNGSCEAGAAQQAVLDLIVTNQAAALSRSMPPSASRRSSRRGSCKGSAAPASSQSLQHGGAKSLQSEISARVSSQSDSSRADLVSGAAEGRGAGDGGVCPVPNPAVEAGDVIGSDLIPTLLLGVGVGPSGAAHLLETLHSLESDESARVALLTQLNMVITQVLST